jgi:predicted acyltransferase
MLPAHSSVHNQATRRQGCRRCQSSPEPALPKKISLPAQTASVARMSEAATPQSTAPGAVRLMSLDVFRGVTIASMMLVNNPGSWSAAYPPLLHAEWHGWTFTDTIFPFFIWIVGVAIPLSTSRRLEQGQSRRELFLHALRRAVILFGLGLLLSSFGYVVDGSLGRLGLGGWLHHCLTNIRIPGVLQRIAVCYLVAMVIFLRTGIRGQIYWTVALLVLYWLVMAFAPFPVNMHGETRYVSGLFERGDNFSAYVDSVVLNGPAIGTHVWRSTKPWDPEGIVSTLPAISTCLFGILTGHLLRARRSQPEKTAWLTVTGALLMWVGELMSFWLPINKSLWTSSYSVFMAGLAMICFGVYYWFVDVKGCRTLVKPFAIYGMNAITVFVLSGLLGRLIMEIKLPAAEGASVALKTLLYENLFVPLASPKNASLLWALLWVAMLYLVAWGMYRKNWFVKF